MSDVLIKVKKFEDLESAIPAMSTDARSKTHQEMIEFYDSLSPVGTIGTYTAIGAVTAGVLPVVGWLTGALVGATIGVFSAYDKENEEARTRMAKLIERVAGRL